MERIQTGTTQSLNLQPEQVRITMIDQTHMYVDPENARGWMGIDISQINPKMIAEHIQRLSVYGDVQMSEIDISGITDLRLKADGLAAITDACMRGGCTSVDYYQALWLDPGKPETFSLFNPDYSRTRVYWRVLNTVLH